MHTQADTENYLEVSDGKNDRVREVDFVSILVDGGRDNRRVDNDRVIGGHGFAAQLHAGVLGRKVDPDVLVQDERYPDLPCNMMIGQRESVSVSQLDQMNPSQLNMTSKLYSL